MKEYCVMLIIKKNIMLIIKQLIKSNVYANNY